MKVEILDFIPQERNNQIGVLDCKVTYTEEKWEVFRGLCLWRTKFGKINVSFPSIKKGEKYLPRYERHPFPKDMFIEILIAFDDYVKKYSIHLQDVQMILKESTP